LGLLNAPLANLLAIVKGSRYRVYSFAFVVGVATIWVTFLHAIEAGIWATAFRLLGAVPTNRSALLYSLEAITTYGHSDLFLAEHWRLMGALEALNGVILIGLTTAFLYGPLRSDPARVAGREGPARIVASVVAAQARRGVKKNVRVESRDDDLFNLLK
jgi:hypothetical protein